MTTNSTRTQNVITAGLAALAAAVSMGLSMGGATRVAEVDYTVTYSAEAVSVHEVTVDEPAYVVVDRAPGAPMATAGLPVQTVVIETPVRVEASDPRSRTVASAEPHGAAADVRVLVHR